MCGYVLAVIKIILPWVNLVSALLPFLQYLFLFCGKILQPICSYCWLLVQTGITRGYSDLCLELQYQLPCWLEQGVCLSGEPNDTVHADLLLYCWLNSPHWTISSMSSVDKFKHEPRISYHLWQFGDIWELILRAEWVHAASVSFTCWCWIRTWLLRRFCNNTDVPLLSIHSRGYEIEFWVWCHLCLSDDSIMFFFHRPVTEHQ